SPHTGDLLTATLAFHDADADAVTLDYQWLKDGTPILGATSPTLDLSQLGNGDRGDALALRVGASDGTASSAPVTSAPVTVAASAPAVSVPLAPGAQKTNDVVTATASVADADADATTLTYVWKVNGATVETTAGTTSTTDTLDLSGAAHGDRGDAVSVEVTATDGSLVSAAASASRTVANSAPTATVALDNPTPGPADTLHAQATTADADGDAVTLTYVWKVNGAVVPGTTGQALDLTGLADHGDTVTVEATPSDGDATGAA